MIKSCLAMHCVQKGGGSEPVLFTPYSASRVAYRLIKVKTPTEILSKHAICWACKGILDYCDQQKGERGPAAKSTTSIHHVRIPHQQHLYIAAKHLVYHSTSCTTRYRFDAASMLRRAIKFAAQRPVA